MNLSKTTIATLGLVTAVNLGLTLYSARMSTTGVNTEVFGVATVEPSASASEIERLLANPDVSSIQSAITEDDVRQLVRDEIERDPQFLLDAVDRHVKTQQAEESANADKKLVEMATAVTKSEGYPFIGNPEGKIEVAYYFDINCSFCKKIDGDLSRFVLANPDVKLVHREMPILTPASKTAAQIGGALFATYPEQYEEFHSALMMNPGASDAKFIEDVLVKLVGEDRAKEVTLKAYNMNDEPIAKEVSNRIEATLATANEAGITGTPFIYVKDANLFIRGAAGDLFEQLSQAANSIRSK
jgi:protein-disulfide isomerase